jgi:hypothetical protein
MNKIISKPIIHLRGWRCTTRKKSKGWEEIASEFQELDEYLAAEHYEVTKGWDKHSSQR